MITFDDVYVIKMLRTNRDNGGFNLNEVTLLSDGELHAVVTLHVCSNL